MSLSRKARRGDTILEQVPASAASRHLDPPCRYHPYARGRYEVAAGLYPLGRDLDNGAADARVFQLDRHWQAYAREKRAARREALSKYVPRMQASGALLAVVIPWLARRLACEYPACFHMTSTRDQHNLHCRLSGETLCFDSGWHLREVLPAPPDPPYRDAWDALGSQVQEDLALVDLSDGKSDRLCALHLCLPNHWAAADKIGQDFAAIHASVPGMDRLNRNAGALLSAAVERGPYVRFAWGLATDPRLNHHPQPPPGVDPVHWRGRGRRFDPARPALYVRVERQVLVGFARPRGLLFTIRTYLEAVAALPAARRQALYRSVAGMDPDTLRYKGLWRDRRAILRHLRELAECASTWAPEHESHSASQDKGHRLASTPRART